MALVRFRVACRGRVELHEVEGSEIEIGRDESCALVVHHPSVAPRHARILVRRGRMILADLGRAKTGTTRGRERVLAPVTIAPGERFGLGDVGFSACPVADGERGLSGTRIAGAQVVAEIDSADAGARRYRVGCDDAAYAELAVARHDLPGAVADRWLEKMKSSSAGSSKRVAPLLRLGTAEGRAFAIESLPAGIRLSALLDGVARGTVHLPVEATIVVVAHLAEAVAALNEAWGAHGAIDPRSVQLGIDGAIALLRPGPLADGDRPVLDEYLAPERRFGLPPTTASDAFALGVLGKSVLCRRDDCPVRIRAICFWLAHAEPARRPRNLAEIAAELRRAAQGAELDPTFGHVARAVRLLAPNLSRRLCTVPPVSGMSADQMTV